MKVKDEIKVIKRFTILLLALISLSCDKDESTPDKTQEGIAAMRYEAVIIEVPNMVLNQNEYNATFAGFNIKVIKIDEHQLAFTIPSTAALGENSLSIAEINTTLKYNVSQAVLKKSADETIAQFTTLGDAYLATLPEQDSNNNYQKFKEFYNNSATAEQKTQMALYYFVNKEAFDFLLQYNPETSNERITSGDIFLITKFLAAVTGGGASVWLTYSQIPADPAGAILGAGAAYFFYTKAKSLGINITELYEIKTTGFTLGSLESTLNKGPQGIISISDNISTTLPFKVQGRALIQSDSNTTNQTVSSFFGKLNYFNDFITKTNSAINWINDNITFTNFSTFDLVTLQTNPPTVSSNVSAEVLQDVSFTINHPNLQLINASLGSSGQLKLKVKVIGNPAANPVTSTLNFSYDDGFSSFSGSFNIEVERTDILFLGMNLENQRSVGAVSCTSTTVFNCIYDQVFTFAGTSTPIGGTLKFKTVWDQDGDGTFEGNAAGQLTSVTITEQNSTNNKVLIGGGFCWGAETTQLKVIYQYVNPEGVAGAIYEVGVSK